MYAFSYGHGNGEPCHGGHYRPWYCMCGLQHYAVEHDERRHLEQLRHGSRNGKLYYGRGNRHNTRHHYDILYGGRLQLSGSGYGYAYAHGHNGYQHCLPGRYDNVYVYACGRHVEQFEPVNSSC